MGPGAGGDGGLSATPAGPKKKKKKKGGHGSPAATSPASSVGGGSVAPAPPAPPHGGGWWPVNTPKSKGWTPPVWRRHLPGWGPLPRLPGHLMPPGGPFGQSGALDTALKKRQSSMNLHKHHRHKHHEHHEHHKHHHRHHHKKKRKPIHHARATHK